MRVVLDTNVLISALLGVGNPKKIVKAGLEKRYELYLSSEILQEFMDKLDVKFDFPREDAIAAFTLLERNAEIIDTGKDLKVIKEDPKDDKILECGVAAKANYIVSGDSHLQKLKKYNEIQIVTPAEFMKIMDAYNFPF